MSIKPGVVEEQPNVGFLGHAAMTDFMASIEVCTYSSLGIEITYSGWAKCFLLIFQV